MTLNNNNNNLCFVISDTLFYLEQNIQENSIKVNYNNNHTNKINDYIEKLEYDTLQLYNNDNNENNIFITFFNSFNHQETEIIGIDSKIIDETIKKIITFPDKINRLLSQPNTKLLNRDLYFSRLVEYFFSFLWETIKNHENENHLLQVLFTRLIHRGLINTILTRFFILLKQIYKNNENENENNNNNIQKLIEMVFISIFHASLKENTKTPFSALKERKVQKNNNNNNITEHFQIFIYQLIHFSVISFPVMKKMTKRVLIHFLNHNNSNELLLLSKTLFPILFYKIILNENISRLEIRFVFQELLSELLEENNHNENENNENEKLILNPIFHAWCQTSFLEGESMKVNRTLSDAILYVCVYYKNKNNKFPSFLLSSLLNGVSIRLETIKSMTLREDGMRVAGAFVLFYFHEKNNENNNIAETFFKGDQNEFAALIQKWLKEEETLNYNPNTNFSNSIVPNNNNNNNHNKKESILQRSVLLNHNNNDPLAPDDPYFFFQKEKEMNHNKMIINEINNTNALLPFGITQFSKDILISHNNENESEENNKFTSFLQQYGTIDVSRFQNNHHHHHHNNNNNNYNNNNNKTILSIKGCYDLLCGIGRGANPQQVEIQKDIEKSLKNLIILLQEKVHLLFSALQKNNNHENENKIILIEDIFNSHGQEVQPYLSPLLTTLTTVQLLCPPEEKNFYIRIKNKIIVFLMVLQPKLSLFYISQNLLFDNKLGIFQRIDLIKNIRRAAHILSAIPIGTEHHHSFQNNNNTQNNKKRIYPPIPSYENHHQKAIVMREGKNTRRWGNAVTDRNNNNNHHKNKNSLNLFADFFYPHFFHCFLSKVQNEKEFRFFTVSDPFSPAEILKLLVIFFQLLKNHRSAFSTLLGDTTNTQNNNNNNESVLFLFLLQVLQHHPNPNIMKLGWLTVGELLRAWAGADPLFIISIHQNKNNEEEEEMHFQLHSSFHGALVLSESWRQCFQLLTVLYDRLQNPKNKNNNDNNQEKNENHHHHHTVLTSLTVGRTAALVMGSLQELAMTQEEMTQVGEQYWKEAQSIRVI